MRGGHYHGRIEDFIFPAVDHPKVDGPSNPTLGRVTPSRQNQARIVELGGHVKFMKEPRRDGRLSSSASR